MFDKLTIVVKMQICLVMEIKPAIFWLAGELLKLHMCGVDPFSSLAVTVIIYEGEILGLNATMKCLKCQWNHKLQSIFCEKSSSPSPKWTRS